MASSLVAHVESLSVSPRIEERLRKGELTQEQVDEFRDFLGEVEHDFLKHRIIKDNRYTNWFEQGLGSDEELRHFFRQFSVFSNQFLIAALQRVINASTIEQARAAKEILLNELGVIYRKPGAASERGRLSDTDKDREGDPDLVSTEGTVDGGTYRFRAAHFEWLTHVGEAVGLDFSHIGKRHHGTPSTLHFCDELIRLYGNEDSQIAEGASFAVENWAAAGFWQQLEDGLVKIQQTRVPQLKLAFFTWHNRVEAQHAGHTMEELEDVYFSEGFDRERFLQGGREVLESIAVFWDGLEKDRVNKVYERPARHPAETSGNGKVAARDSRRKLPSQRKVRSNGKAKSSVRLPGRTKRTTTRTTTARRKKK